MWGVVFSACIVYLLSFLFHWRGWVTGRSAKQSGWRSSCINLNLSETWQCTTSEPNDDNNNRNWNCWCPSCLFAEQTIVLSTLVLGVLHRFFSVLFLRRLQNACHKIYITPPLHTESVHGIWGCLIINKRIKLKTAPYPTIHNVQSSAPPLLNVCLLVTMRAFQMTRKENVHIYKNTSTASALAKAAIWEHTARIYLLPLRVVNRLVHRLGSCQLHSSASRNTVTRVWNI